MMMKREHQKKLIGHSTFGVVIIKSGDRIICCRGLVVQVDASRNSAFMELCGLGLHGFCLLAHSD